MIFAIPLTEEPTPESTPSLEQLDIQKTSRLLKFQIAGEDQSGKSSLVLRYGDKFYNYSKNNNGSLDTGSVNRTLLINGVSINTEVQDYTHAGGRIVKADYQNVHAIILTLDLTDPGALKKLRTWKQGLAGYQKDIILVGTKCDDIKNRCFTKEELTTSLEDFDFPLYIEASAKTGENVIRVFEEAAKRALHN